MQVVPAQGFTPTASPDDMLLRMWLHGKSANTALAYEADARAFLVFTTKPIAATTLPDLQLWAESMAGAAHATRARRLAAVKSFLTFVHRLGAMPMNPGAAYQLEKATETSAERILSETTVKRMIAAEPDARSRALLRLVYVCGLRASEAAGLRWRDMAGTEKKGGSAKVLGKGGKERRVGVPADLWRELAALTAAPLPDSPVVPARSGRGLDRKCVWRVVKRAARRAGATDAASPHWLRHSHASHALDNGAPIQTVREGLGHASLATTTRYAHAKPGETSAAFIRG